MPMTRNWKAALKPFAIRPSSGRAISGWPIIFDTARSLLFHDRLSGYGLVSAHGCEFYNFKIGLSSYSQLFANLGNPVLQIVIVGNAGHFVVADFKKGTGRQTVFLSLRGWQTFIGFNIFT